MPEPTLKRANAIRYCFDDPDLDFMFQWAAGAPQDRRARPRRAVLHRLRHGWEAEAWHAALSVRHKTFLRLDGATGRRRTVRSTTQPGSPKRYATG
jgi:hypothetical protein